MREIFPEIKVIIHNVFTEDIASVLGTPSRNIRYLIALIKALQLAQRSPAKRHRLHAVCYIGNTSLVPLASFINDPGLIRDSSLYVLLFRHDEY